MNKTKRNKFDEQVEWVLARLPKNVLRLLHEVPLHVEDQPAKRLMRELKIEEPDELCGYFSGVPYTEGRHFGAVSFSSTGEPVSNSITIFRQGIIAIARDEWGKVKRSSLREQIRITILHELAHLHGMDDNEIAEIGYG